MNKPKNIVGNKYGTFTVIKYVGVKGNGQTQWLCRCDCGFETVIIRNDLIRGKKRCDCQKERNYKPRNSVMDQMQTIIEQENERLHGTKYACAKNDYCRLCNPSSDTPCATAKLKIQRLRKNYLLAQDLAEPYIVGQY